MHTREQRKALKSSSHETSEFPFMMSLRQRPILSPYMFTLAINELTINIPEKVKCMLFANDIVLVDETRVGSNVVIRIFIKRGAPGANFEA